MTSKSRDPSIGIALYFGVSRVPKLGWGLLGPGLLVTIAGGLPGDCSRD
jgi:hypothetical protein